LAKVDATTEKAIGEKVKIEGYPTLKFYINQNPVDFTGDRTEEGILQWLKKKTGPASNLVETAEALDKILSDNEVVVVHFGSGDATEQSVFETVAQHEEDVIFAHTTSSALRLHYKVANDVRIVLFKKFDEGRNDYTGAIEGGEITAFIKTNELPTVMPFDQKSADKIFSSNNDCLFLFIKSKEAECCKAPQAALKEAASALKGKILLSYADLTEDLGQRLAEYVGVTDKDTPCVRIVSPRDDDVRKYLYTGDITSQGIISFQEQFAKGELKPFYKSEALPEINDQPVKVIIL
jgi:protein disulfide-isomerase A1